MFGAAFQVLLSNKKQSLQFLRLMNKQYAQPMSRAQVMGLNLKRANQGTRSRLTPRLILQRKKNKQFTFLITFKAF